MARKKKGATPARERTYQLTPEKDLVNLLRQCRGHEKNIAEYVGSLREKIAYAVEKKHLHKSAFAKARALDKMEAEKLAEWFAHFDHYCDVLGLRKRAEDAPALALEEEGEPDEEENTAAGSVPRPRVVGGTASAGEPG